MRTAYSARQDLLILKVLKVPFPVEQYGNNMYTMNDTKQFFCVSEVLVHITACSSSNHLYATRKLL